MTARLLALKGGSRLIIAKISPDSYLKSISYRASTLINATTTPFVFTAVIAHCIVIVKILSPGKTKVEALKTEGEGQREKTAHLSNFDKKGDQRN